MLTEDADFDSIRDEWDSLADDSGRYACSLRWDWNRLWWQHFADAQSRLFIIACRDQFGALVGLAPFFLHTNDPATSAYSEEIRFIGTGFDITLSEREILARRGHEQAVAIAVVECLRQNNKCNRLWLSAIPSDSRTLLHFQHALGDGAQTTFHFQTSYIDANTDWKTFKATLSPKTRQEISRRTRRLLESHECKFYRVKTEADFDETMPALIELHRARWKLKDTPDTLDSPLAEEFIYAVARRALESGRLRLWALRLDGAIAAVELAFFDNGAIHFYQRGFNPSYSKEGIGSVTLALCFKHCIESGEVTEIILGSKSEYKSHWTKATRTNVELTYTRPA